MRRTLTRLNLTLRAGIELGTVSGLAYWGYRTGTHVGDKILLAFLAPTLVFCFWGLIDFRRAGRYAESLRLIQELAIAGVALLRSGQAAYGWALIALSVVHHSLICGLGERLLKH